MNPQKRLTSSLALAIFIAALAQPVAADGDGEPASQYLRAGLPPILEFVDGTPVRNLADFARRKQEIRHLFCKYFLGTFPDQPPKIVATEQLEEKHLADGSTRRRLKLTFDTPNKASFEMWVWIPTGAGPHPLLLTQPRNCQIYWAEDALRRGYMVCLYPGLDCHHQEADYPNYENIWRTFQAEYPEVTWQSSLGIQAWLASRALDHLLDPRSGYNLAKDQVGIIGFSRYGKQSLYAAAFDERFTAVVARSSGVPTAAAYRFSGRNTLSESLADFPAPWAKAGVIDFNGRENELPIEGHALLGLIAPRRCMLHTAYYDGADPTFAVEQTYLQGREVYRFLGQPENLRNIYRSGNHSSGPPPEQIIEAERRQNLDWFDLAFKRGTAQQSDFPEVLLHQFDWEAWKQKQLPDDLVCPVAAGRTAESSDRERRIRWALGRPPKEIDGAGQYHIKTKTELAIPNDERDRWACANTARMPVSFSGKLHADVYYNPAIERPAPAVIWLHPYSYGTGSNECYGVEDTTVYHRLAQQGFVVLSYDQCGFGGRLLEGCRFYEQYPSWSRLGRMVYDVSRAVDFLIDGKGISQGKLPAIDSKQIYVLGYSLGGSVGLHAAALDSRIAGVAAFCGFTPLRTNSNDRPTGGNESLYRLHALQPKLGLFAGNEASIPYDYDDVLALIAPRPCLIDVPKRDRFASFDEVVACVERIRPAWDNHGKPAAITLSTRDDINRFQRDQQLMFLEWITKLAKAG